jgi:hypothetical protein
MISWMAALDGRQKMMSASMGQEMRNGIDGCEKKPYLSMFKSDISKVINKISFSTCQ